jgi:hypothetical protein
VVVQDTLLENAHKPQARVESHLEEVEEEAEVEAHAIIATKLGTLLGNAPTPLLQEQAQVHHQEEAAAIDLVGSVERQDTLRGTVVKKEDHQVHPLLPHGVIVTIVASLVILLVSAPMLNPVILEVIQEEEEEEVVVPAIGVGKRATSPVSAPVTLDPRVEEEVEEAEEEVVETPVILVAKVDTLRGSVPNLVEGKVASSVESQATLPEHAPRPKRTTRPLSKKKKDDSSKWSLLHFPFSFFFFMILN